jgi:tetratricopeptide (TPR) repeat protein
MQASLSHYRILEQIGAGGMSVVYRAHDEHLDRDVALKVLPSGTVVESSARRHFQKEALTLSKLNHPNIATVHDFDTQDDIEFLVEELIDGLSLDVMLASGPLSEPEIINLGLQLVEGVAAAHEHGIIHRDIKPANVRITPEARLKILDFGLATMLRGKASPTAVTESLGDTKTFVGTLPYMAPEQLLEHKLDERTDIWAIGCVLYEMAVGRRPFLGSGPALTDAILHQHPPSLAKLNPHINSEIEAVILKCLEKDPDRRYSRAREIAVDIRRILTAPVPQGVKTRMRRFSPPFQTSAKKPAQKEAWQQRTYELAFAITILAVLGFVLARIWEPTRGKAVPERVRVLISDFEISGDVPVPDKGVREGLSIDLEQSRHVTVFPRSRAFEVLQRMKKEGVSQLNEALGREICQRENLQVLLTGTIERVGPVFQITVRGLDPLRGTTLFAEQERFGRDDQLFDRVDSLAKNIRKDLGESRGGIENASRPLADVTTSSLQALQLFSQAKDAKDQGKDEQVEGLLQGALRLDPDFAMAHRQLGQYYSAVVGKNERALAELERAYQLRQEVTDREQRKIEAQFYDLQERYDEKAQALRVLVSLYPDDAEAHLELGSAYYDLGQLDEAIAQMRETLRLNPFSAPAYGSLVLFLARDSHNEAAISTANEAEQRSLGSARMHWGLGLAYLGLGNVSSARQEFQRIGGATETNRDLQELCEVVADLYEGKLASTERELKKQIEVVRQDGGLQLFRRYLLGRILLSRGEKREAELQADIILQTPRHSAQGDDFLNAGVLYARAGKLAKARQVLRHLRELQDATPSSSNRASFRNLEGEIFLAEANPLQAEVSFSMPSRAFSPFVSSFGIARAFQLQQRWDRAAEGWEEVVRRKGEILQNGFPPDLPTAHIELARTYCQLHNNALARQHYEEALRIWQHADELNLLRDARGEVRLLTPEASSPEQPKAPSQRSSYPDK